MEVVQKSSRNPCTSQKRTQVRDKRLLLHLEREHPNDQAYSSKLQSQIKRPQNKILKIVRNHKGCSKFETHSAFTQKTFLRDAALNGPPATFLPGPLTNTVWWTFLVRSLGREAMFPSCVVYGMNTWSLFDTILPLFSISDLILYIFLFYYILQDQSNEEITKLQNEKEYNKKVIYNLRWAH